MFSCIKYFFLVFALFVFSVFLAADYLLEMTAFFDNDKNPFANFFSFSRPPHSADLLPLALIFSRFRDYQTGSPASELVLGWFLVLGSKTVHPFLV